MDLESEADIRSRKILEATTIRVDDRFQTGLLWNVDNSVMPNSYEMAYKRLIGIENKMKKNEQYADKYRSQMANYLSKGYARKLTPQEAKTIGPRTWYLPHFGVQNPNKPNKFRLVFDAAASVEGVSLNSALMKGPDQYQPLPVILFKFRQGGIAVSGDIKEMFLQIKIIPDDQQSQRFLWRTDSSRPPEIYAMTSMTFGASMLKI